MKFKQSKLFHNSSVVFFNIRVSVIKKCVLKRVSVERWQDLQKNYKAKFYPYVLFKSNFKIIDSLNTDQIKCTLFTVPWNVVYVFLLSNLPGKWTPFLQASSCFEVTQIDQHSVMSIV